MFWDFPGGKISFETLQKVGKDEAFEINKLGVSGFLFDRWRFLWAEKVGEIEEFRGNLETLEARCRGGRRRKISTSAFGWPVASS